MIAFETSLNNELLAVAGNEALSVLTFMLDVVPSYAATTGTQRSCSLTLSLEGMTEEESLDWICTRTLSLNDTLRLKLVEATTSTPPVMRDDEATMDNWQVIQPHNLVVVEVYKNGALLCRAGHVELSTLSVHVVALGHLGNTSLGTTPQQNGESPAGHTIDLSISGITKSNSGARTNARWVKDEALVIGDELLFKIVDAVGADTPKSSRPLST